MVCLPAHDSSAKTIPWGLTECLIHLYSHSIASDQGTSFTADEDGNGLRIIEFVSLIMLPVILRQSLYRTVDVFLRTSSVMYAINWVATPLRARAMCALNQ